MSSSLCKRVSEHLVIASRRSRPSHDRDLQTGAENVSNLERATDHNLSQIQSVSIRVHPWLLQSQ